MQAAKQEKAEKLDGSETAEKECGIRYIRYP